MLVRKRNHFLCVCLFLFLGTWGKSVTMEIFWAEMAAQGHATLRKASTVQVSLGTPVQAHVLVLEVSSCLIFVNSWYPVPYSLVMMIIMTMTFDGSVVCQALIVSHTLSHLIPTLSTRSLNRGPRDLRYLAFFYITRDGDVRIWAKEVWL